MYATPTPPRASVRPSMPSHGTVIRRANSRCPAPPLVLHALLCTTLALHAGSACAALLTRAVLAPAFAQPTKPRAPVDPRARLSRRCRGLAGGGGDGGRAYAHHLPRHRRAPRPPPAVLQRLRQDLDDAHAAALHPHGQMARLLVYIHGPLCPRAYTGFQPARLTPSHPHLALPLQTTPKGAAPSNLTRAGQGLLGGAVPAAPLRGPRSHAPRLWLCVHGIPTRAPHLARSLSSLALPLHTT